MDTSTCANQAGDGHQPGGPAPGRSETPEEQADRNMAELLNELRIAKLGVQVLFGFLLVIPFTSRFAFSTLSSGQRAIYIADLVTAAVGTALLTGPVAYHRALFHQRAKAGVVAVADRFAVAGLASIALSAAGGVWLVLTIVSRGWAVAFVPGLVLAVFVLLWGVLPLAARRRQRRRQAAAGGATGGQTASSGRLSERAPGSQPR